MISWCSRDRRSRWFAGLPVRVRPLQVWPARVLALRVRPAWVLPAQVRRVRVRRVQVREYRRCQCRLRRRRLCRCRLGRRGCFGRRLGRRGDGNNRLVDDRRLRLRDLGMNRLHLQRLILIRGLQLNRGGTLWRALLGNRLFCLLALLRLLPLPAAPSGFPGRFAFVRIRHFCPLFQCQTKWQNSAMFTIELRFLLVSYEALAW